jgi:molybdopterin-biosynthesis enzyme MoeA-like protein
MSVVARPMCGILPFTSGKGSGSLCEGQHYKNYVGVIENGVLKTISKYAVAENHLFSNNEREILRRSIKNSNKNQTTMPRKSSIVKNTMQFAPTRVRQPGVRMSQPGVRMRNTRKYRKNRNTRKKSRKH